MDLARLRDLLNRGIEDAVRGLASAYPSERLIGFALGTDDDLGSLFHLACTAESAAESPDDVRFAWNEWTREGPSGVLDEVSRLLLDHAGSVDAADSRVFDALVDALAAARGRGLLSPEVFLVVGSTDPGPTLERLERAAVERLNEPAVVDAWREELIGALRYELDDLLEKPRGEWGWDDIDKEKSLAAQISALEAQRAR